MSRTASVTRRRRLRAAVNTLLSPATSIIRRWLPIEPGPSSARHGDVAGAEGVKPLPKRFLPGVVELLPRRLG